MNLSFIFIALRNFLADPRNPRKFPGAVQTDATIAGPYWAIPNGSGTKSGQSDAVDRDL
jgi:hypothetical protein